MSEMPYTQFSLISCLGLESSNTHKLPAMKKLFRQAMDRCVIDDKIINPKIIDPFARQCQWGTLRNDINPEFYPQYTTHMMDALDFLTDIESNSC